MSADASSLPEERDFMAQLETTPPAARVAAQDCPICHEPITGSFKTSCNHYFCLKCAREWYESSSTCPSCRTKLYKEAAKDNAFLHIQVDGTGELRVIDLRDVEGSVVVNGNRVPPPAWVFGRPANLSLQAEESEHDEDGERGHEDVNEASEPRLDDDRIAAKHTDSTETQVGAVGADAGTEDDKPGDHDDDHSEGVEADSDADDDNDDDNDDDEEDDGTEHLRIERLNFDLETSVDEAQIRSTILFLWCEAPEISGPASIHDLTAPTLIDLNSLLPRALAALLYIKPERIQDDDEWRTWSEVCRKEWKLMGKFLERKLRDLSKDLIGSTGQELLDSLLAGWQDEIAGSDLYAPMYSESVLEWTDGYFDQEAARVFAYVVFFAQNCYEGVPYEYDSYLDEEEDEDDEDEDEDEENQEGDEERSPANLWGLLA